MSVKIILDRIEKKCENAKKDLGLYDNADSDRYSRKFCLPCSFCVADEAKNYVYGKTILN